MEREKKVQVSVRLPEPLARKLKAACALKGISIQECLESLAQEFVEKEKPE